MKRLLQFASLTGWFIRRTLPFWWILVILIIPIAKICETIAWDWVWVMLPVWLPVALIVLLPGSVILFILIFSLYKAKF